MDFRYLIFPVDTITNYLIRWIKHRKTFLLREKIIGFRVNVMPLLLQHKQSLLDCFFICKIEGNAENVWQSIQQRIHFQFLKTNKIYIFLKYFYPADDRSVELVSGIKFAPFDIVESKLRASQTIHLKQPIDTVAHTKVKLVQRK